MRRIIPSLTAIQIGTLQNLKIDILLEQISLDFLGSRALTEEEAGITNAIHSLVPLMLLLKFVIEVLFLELCSQE